ncbi:MAG: hypothetical protein RH917_11840 [Lacipirellulaceae bacterium]
MNCRLACLLLILAASGGCRACSNCYDYSSPVAPGPYSGRGRAGSVFADGTRQTPRKTEQPEQQLAVATEQPQAEHAEIDYSLAIEPASYEVPAGEAVILAPLPEVTDEQPQAELTMADKPTSADKPLPTVQVVMPQIPNEPTVTNLPPLFVQ